MGGRPVRAAQGADGVRHYLGRRNHRHGLVHGLVSLFVARVILGFGEGATFPTATRAMSY